jgi:hypothetical protein
MLRRKELTRAGDGLDLFCAVELSDMSVRLMHDVDSPPQVLIKNAI